MLTRLRQWLTRQPEVGDHGARASARIPTEDYVVALEIAVDHLVAMRFRQPIADLPPDGASLRFRQRPTAEACRERLTLQKLHGEKVDFSAAGRGRVDLENPAHVGMADFTGEPYFRRQTSAESAPGALERDAAP